MIFLDTNILVRLVTGDTPEQAALVKKALELAEERGETFCVGLPVILETVWVLTNGYGYSRREVSSLLFAMATSERLDIEHLPTLLNAVSKYSRASDFADMLFVAYARLHEARGFLSFDKKLKTLEPGLVLTPEEYCRAT